MNAVMTRAHTHTSDLGQWIELDKTALAHNLKAIERAAMPGAEVMAVVKANAYGHGLLEIATHLKSHVAYFGVSTIDEALALRRLEIDTPILLFGIHVKSAVEAACEAGVTLTLSDLDQARQISRIASDRKKAIKAHIKVDSGMGRLGIAKTKVVDTIQEIMALPMLTIEGIYTHFAQGEKEGDAFTKTQIDTFYGMLLSLDSKHIRFAYRHAANSTAIVNVKEAHFNLIRPGLMLYGLYPSQLLKKKIDLKPVLSWKARVILVKHLGAGESTGYSRAFKAKEPTTVAILPVGYSHGYPFALSGKGEVIIRGKRYPIAGRISMDYLAVDMKGIKRDIAPGEVVTLMGGQGHQSIGAEELAEKADTIPYELVTRLDVKIPRIVRAGTDS